MYAEYFSVGPWLENPAQFLQWSVYGNNQRASIVDVKASLSKFWNALAALKAQASTPTQWADILSLDGRSQWEYGRLLDRVINNDLGTVNALAGMDPMTTVLHYLGMDGNPLSALQAARDQAYAASKSLAAQSVDAAKQAGVDAGQAGRMVQVAQTSQKTAAVNTGVENNLYNGSFFQMKDLGDAIKMPVLGVPLWVWLAGGVALLVLLEAGPSMAAASLAQRYAEE